MKTSSEFLPENKRQIFLETIFLENIPSHNNDINNMRNSNAYCDGRCGWRWLDAISLGVYTSLILHSRL